MASFINEGRRYVLHITERDSVKMSKQPDYEGNPNHKGY